LREAPPDDPARVAVERAAAHLTKSAKQKRRLARKQEGRRADREALAISARAAAYFTPALPGVVDQSVRELRNQKHCYVCKQPFRRLHAFYHALCLGCAERNFAARGDTADLAGRRAIVTGGRIKIGFEIALGLVRAGARVTVTTRFPRDAEQRYAAIDPELRERITIAGVDFLDLRGVSAWIAGELERGEPLDILINNAAQTVRRPAEYYARLTAGEREASSSSSSPALPGLQAALPGLQGALPGLQGALPGLRAALPGLQGALPGSRDLPELGASEREALTLLFPDRVDAEGKPVDLRTRNSWVMTSAEIDPAEVAEVHVVNAIVPFLIASRLRPLMTASSFADRYIVNVSAMEGVFSYRNKQPKHPHTNMAKAALNMFTRTSAPEFLTDGVYMNSVDTGWITQENPYPVEERLKAGGFCPPLDIVDGAARVLAPVFRGVRGDRIAGAFFKDYEPSSW
jgi:NAD(P)-dependent dehydrogenase (short-subunit alcohol dehydrogenase family)